MDEITQINTYFRSFIYLIKNRVQIHREKIKIVELPKPLPIKHGIDHFHLRKLT